ncbi:MAG TPA: choice-of-anchor V domain-containing protein, partial [Gemmataceae bacterium]|nr:choice-of-anchor V domain-containing protein [Gemmataceae bacterium]
LGTPLNGGGGKVEVQFPNGLQYTPGQSQTFTIVITDSAARVYGFEMTARLASDPANGQAGDFTPGASQQVKCDDDNLPPKGPAGCPANRQVQFIEHTTPFRTNTIQVQWTAPASNVGDVKIYVAANAANNSGNENGDHIYTANYTLKPDAPATAAPAITKVVSASGFNADAGLASGTWLEIYGTGFSDDRSKISVTVNNLPAFVAFSNATQVNVQAPDDSTLGPGIPIQVTANGVKSNSVAMEKKAIAPALLAPEAFKIDGKQYVVAQFADQAFVGRTGLIAGLNFRPAKPGEVVTIYGIGFGPVTPAVASGTVAAGLTAIQPQPVMRIGGTTVTLQYAGLTPGLIGLYQFNVVVPTLAPGEYPLTIDTGGVSANSGLFFTVGQ